MTSSSATYSRAPSTEQEDLQATGGRRPAIDHTENVARQAPSVRDQLDEEISRAEEAYHLMLVADTCLKNGAEQLLLLLGFTQAHVDELRAHAGSGKGYPTYSLRSIRKTLRQLRQERQQFGDSHRTDN